MSDSQAESAPPKAGKADVAHALAKAVISEVPLIGAPAAELFSLVVTPPLERRRAERLNAIAERLKENDHATRPMTYVGWKVLAY